MGKASRGKAERRRRREAGAAAAAPPEAAPRRGPAPSAAPAGPPGDFPPRARLGVLLLALLVVASYSPVLTAGFVWDDIGITGAWQVREWTGLWDIWFAPGSLVKEGHYWPITYTSFWLEHKLWGFAPFGYHAVNLLLQLVNTLLVWRLMLRLAAPGAWLIAAVFAVHPLHVESVAWVIERKDLLSGMFYLSAALVWLRFAEEPRPGRYLATMGLFAASMLSKTVTVTFPAAMLVLAWWKRGRATLADVRPLLPFFAVGLAIALGDLNYYLSRERLDFDFSLVERIQIASHALWFYLGKLLWPVDLAVIYPFWDTGAGNLAEWGYVAAAVALAAGLWLARERIGRGPLAGALFFVVTLSPVLGFVSFGYMQFSYVADRFQYLAGLGVMAVLVGAAAHAAGRLPETARKGLLGVALLGVAAMAGLSWKQSHIYRDEITFFNHIIDLNPTARDAHHNLGKALQDVGRMDEALVAARIAVEQRPEFASAHSNLGLALMHFGEMDEAEEALRNGLQADPRDKNVLQNLGDVLRLKGRHEEAAKHYSAILKDGRDHTWAYAGRGGALFELERYGEAVVDLRKALSLEPDMVHAALIHVLAGESLERLGRLDEAGRHYESALRVDPAMERAQANLIGMLLDQGRDAEAERYLRGIRGMDREGPAGLRNVAELFRKRQQYERALEWYDKVLQVAPDHVQAHAGRGDVLYRLGRHEEAIGSLGRAVALDPAGPAVPALRLMIGAAAQTLGRTEVAQEQYGLVLEDDPQQADALGRLAMLRHRQGRREEAIQLYRSYLAVSPDQAGAYTHLGIVYYEAGRIEEARSALEKALSLDPSAGAAKAMLDRIRQQPR